MFSATTKQDSDTKEYFWEGIKWKNSQDGQVNRDNSVSEVIH